MYKKLLVPVRETIGSEKAVEVACNLASQLGASVHLINVNYGGIEDRLIREMMERAVKACGSKGIKASFSVHTAISKEEVPQTIATISADYDIIVMGHCRYRKIYRFLHHSVAEELILLTACPVIVAATDCPEKHGTG